MRVLLVQPPLLGEANRLHLTPPLGLLSIGALLREESLDVDVLDLNLMAFQDPSLVDPATFYDDATSLIATLAPDVVGFTSMALESHVGLELARRVKRLDPQVVTLFGGPHFGSIATEAMTLYPWMDYVVTGAAEHALVALMRHLRGAATPGDLTNIAHRTASGVALDSRPVTTYPLDELPYPAHDLVPLPEYFDINSRRMLCIEHARGCQLRCTFCYSEAHWGHGEITKSIERTIGELSALAGLGAAHAFFVADNFVTSRERAERLCGAIAEARLGLTWHCYATLAQLDEPTVKTLAGAGCIGVFIGVDAVSPINKRAFRKTYFKGWEPLRERLETCLAYGVKPTCSFMLSMDDDLEGVEETLRTTVLAKNIGVNLSLNALAVYNQTALHGARRADGLRYSNAKPALLYSTHAINCTNAYAEAAPHLFPMHQDVDTPDALEVDLFTFCRVARDLIQLAPTALLRCVYDCERPLTDLIYAVALRVLDAIPAERINDGKSYAPVFLEALTHSVAAEKAVAAGLEFDLLIKSHTWLSDEREVTVSGSSQRYQVRLGAFRIADLHTDPGNLRRLDRCPAGSAQRPHLLTLADGEVTATPLTAPLQKFLRTWSDGGSLSLAAELFEELKERGLIVACVEGAG